MTSSGPLAGTEPSSFGNLFGPETRDGFQDLARIGQFGDGFTDFMGGFPSVEEGGRDGTDLNQGSRYYTF